MLRPLTILRSTVVVDRNGDIAAKYPVNGAAADSKKILETV